MKVELFGNELVKYEESFRAFVQENQLPEEWFVVPDHVALKCADQADYEETCTVFGSLVDEEGVWEIELDARHLGSAKLRSALSVAGYEMHWIEIMQPRPGKEMKQGFVEHTEFVYPNFDEITAYLDGHNIAYELQENPGHSWINVVIDDQEREIKFNNAGIEEVTTKEKAEGKLSPFKAAT